MNTENSNPPIPENPAYMLRTCNLDGTSKNGFVWPTEGYVECPDWNPEPKQGHGLHGLLNGEGNGRLLYADDSKRWLIVAIDPNEIVDLGGRIKVPRGWVMASYQGDFSKDKATTQMIKLCPGSAVSYASIVVGNAQLAYVGYGGVAYAGNHGVAYAGNHGEAYVSGNGTAYAGHYGQAIVEKSGFARVGNHGKAEAKDFSVAIAGYGGQARVRDRGVASVKNFGRAIGGKHSLAKAGYLGIVSAGKNGTICIDFQVRLGKYKTHKGIVGKNGITPDTLYKVVVDKETRNPRFVTVEDKD